MKNDFENFCNTLNLEELNEIWNIAKTQKKKRSKLAITIFLIVDILFFVCFIGVINTIMMNSFNIIMLILPTLFCGIIDIMIYAFMTFNVTNQYNNSYKEKVVDSLLKHFFDEVDYIPKKEMPEIIYDEGHYNYNYNRYYSDDYVEAVIDNKYPIKMAEVTTQLVETKRDSEGNTETQTTTLFSGLFAVIDIGKSIKNEINIQPNYSIFKKDKLEMDSQEFEKYFDVSAKDKIIGMQILTHDVMDMLIGYRTLSKESFDILINNNKLYIRFHVGNMFENNFNKKDVIDKQKLEKYYNIIDFIYSLSKEMIKTVEETQI